MNNIYVSNDEAVDINVYENYGGHANKGNVNLKTEETTTAKVSIDFDLFPETLEMHPDSKVANKYRIMFKYNVKVPCYLSVFLVAKVVVDRDTNRITGIFPKYPNDVKTIECTVGEGQTTTEDFCEFNLTNYSLDEIFQTVN
jgi:hypothetical protein